MTNKAWYARVWTCSYTAAHHRHKSGRITPPWTQKPTNNWILEDILKNDSERQDREPFQSLGGQFSECPVMLFMQDSLLLLIVIACPSHLYQLQFQANLIKSAGNVFWLCLHYAANAHHGVTQLRLGRIKTNAKHGRDELGLIRPFGEAVDMDYGLIYLWCCESLLSDRYLICFICCNNIFIFDNSFQSSVYTSIFTCVSLGSWWFPSCSNVVLQHGWWP